MLNSKPENPMKGLLPFEAADASQYYIDAKQIEAFARQLERNHFVVLRGPSGVGKTSFLNAVFSEAYTQILPISDRWVSMYVRPGLHPIKNMAYALSMVPFSLKPLDPDFAVQTEALLESSANGLAEVFEKHGIAPGIKMLLVIDPLDDLFLLSNTPGIVDHEQRISKFINLLCVFEQQSKGLPVHVAISFSNSMPEKIGSYPRFLDLIERNKFVFKGPQIEELPAILANIVPDQVKKSHDYESFTKLLITEVNMILSDNPEWLFYLQHALQRTLDLWLIHKGDLRVCYQQIGGIKDSIVQHANEIYEEHLKKTVHDHKRILELFFRSMMDGKGELIPMQYAHLVDLTTRYYKDHKEHIEKMVIRPFLRDLGPEGLGFLDIVRSADEADRAKVLREKGLMNGHDIICVKNQYLARVWPLMNTFRHAKSKLMNEYEWYARIALEKSTVKDYPTTLQPYALADPHRDKSKDPEEFHVIDELLRVNEAWVHNNFGLHRKDQATLEHTKAYILQGIKHWQIKEQEEKAAVQKAERKKKLISRLLWSALFMGLVVYALFQEMYRLETHMKEQLDCIYYDNKRILSFVDSVHIKRLSSFSDKDSIARLRLNVNAETWKDTLKYFSDKMDPLYNGLYKEGIIDFSLDYLSWKRRCDSIVDKGRLVHKAVLTEAVRDEDFLYSNTSITEINSPWTCESVTIPNDSVVYYINCRGCEDGH